MSGSSDSVRLVAPCVQDPMPRDALVEEQLVARAQIGDRVALEQIYQLHADAVFRRLTRLLGPVPEREDLLQQVFVELFRGLQRFRGEASLGSYLYRIATNLALDQLRRRGRRRVASDRELAELPASSPSPEAAAIRRERAERVWRCLDRIKPKKRVAFLLRVSEGLSVEEIAEQVGARPAAVAKRIQHAQRELLAMLSREERGSR